MAPTAESGDGRAAAGRPVAGSAPARFPQALMHAAATMYYLHDATQAEVAAQLGTSRATVSRLLREARESGIVRIEVLPLEQQDGAELAERLRQALGLRAVHLCREVPRPLVPAALSAVLSEALTAVGLRPGDVLLVSSGRTVHDVAREGLPQLPGVLVAPMVGGQDEPEDWYQTNEITRQVAARVGGVPQFLHAPAMPGEELHASLLADPGIQRIFELWRTARCAVMGLGAPPLTRESIPRFVPTDAPSLREAVGDVGSRFYDADGVEIGFPGSERLVSTPLQVLREIPTAIAVAHGEEKVLPVVAGARGGYFTELVIDPPTARSVLAVAQERTEPAPEKRRSRRHARR